MATTESSANSRINTILLSLLSGLFVIGVGLAAWAGKEIYAEVRSTHDTVLTMRMDMTNQIGVLRGEMSGADKDLRNEVQLQLTDLRARQAAIETRQAAIELELNKIRIK